eukprot:TRINITY_DN19250_c0_g1_i1.p1 TRINITY_DN19250_c0_g1~~TRINITY_DN19250_c0_g1_i1.p1  ORF type:complete len:1366 (-),score=216.92 TRINITY_DN19250_c0_g1_i1:136-4233(-)
MPTTLVPSAVATSGDVRAISSELALALDQRSLQLGLAAVAPGVSSDDVAPWARQFAQATKSDQSTSLPSDRTALRLLACLRQIQWKLRRGRHQLQLLKLVHSWQEDKDKVKAAESMRRSRPGTPEILREAQERLTFNQPCRSDIWRKRELLSEDDEDSPPPKPMKLPPLQVAKQRGFRNLARFRQADAAKPSPALQSSATLRSEKLLGLEDAVELVKEGGWWKDEPGVRPVRRPSAQMRSVGSLPSLSQRGGRDPMTGDRHFRGSDGSVASSNPALTPKSVEASPTSQCHGVDGFGDDRTETIATALPSKMTSPLALFPRLASSRPLPPRRLRFPHVYSNEEKPREFKELDVDFSKPRTSATPSITHVSLTSSREEALDDELGLAPPPPNVLPTKLRHPPLWTRQPNVLAQTQSRPVWSSMGPDEHLSVGTGIGVLDSTPQWAYSFACEKSRVLPTAYRPIVNAIMAGNAIGFERPESSGGTGPKLRVDLSHYGVGDGALAALGETMARIPKIEVLNLAGSNISGPATCKFLRLRVPPFGGSLKELDFSRSRQLGAGIFTTIAELLVQDKLRILETLRFDTVPVPEQCWLPLLHALDYAGTLKQLGFADTRMGLVSQDPCVEIARLLKNTMLTALDISGNFFRQVGCEHLARALEATEALLYLDISFNAGDHLTAPEMIDPPAMPTEEEEVAEQAQDSDDEQAPVEPPSPPPPEPIAAAVYPPLLLVCEGLLRNETLQALAMAQCSLEYCADFILGRALLSHKRLKWLDLSTNPHMSPSVAASGLGCLLRAVAERKSSVDYVNLADMRESSFATQTIVFDRRDPSDSYALNLEHPQHRFVLRELLERPQVAGKASAACFEDVVREHPEEPAGPWSISNVQRDSKGEFQVPSEGNLRFTYTVPCDCGAPERNPLHTAADWYKLGRVSLCLSRSVAVLAMYDSCKSDEQRRHFFRDAADALLLKTAHLHMFVQKSVCTVQLDALYQLLPAVDDLQYTIPDNPFSHRHFELKTRCQIRELFWLNLQNPTGRYSLDLSNPSDRAVALRLQALSNFERALLQAEGRPDISRRGDGEPVMRLAVCVAEGSPKGYDALGGFSAKRFGDLTIPTVGRLELDYASWTRAPRSRSGGRSVAAPPDVDVQRVVQVLMSSRASAISKLRAFRSVSHHLILTLKDVLDVVDIFVEIGSGATVGGSLSIDAVVVCFSRCSERQKLVSPLGLYNASWSDAEASEFGSRLGAVHVFDWQDCESEATNRPGGNTFELDLAVNEERCIFLFLLELSQREGAEGEGYKSIVNATWTEGGGLPPGWYDMWMESLPESVPSKGVFSCVYKRGGLPEGGEEVEEEEEEPPPVNIEVRKEIAAQRLGS